MNKYLTKIAAGYTNIDPREKLGTPSVMPTATVKGGLRTGRGDVYTGNKPEPLMTKNLRRVSEIG